jgi:hypothetical protein
MDDAQPHRDTAIIGAKGQSEPTGLRLTRRKRRRIRGTVELQGNNIGAGIAAGYARCKGASVGQCHLRLAGIGESLFRGYNNVLAPERSGTPPMSRHGNRGNQRPGELRALRQRFGQVDERVFTNIGHDLFSYST